jgi:hypothetical protein
MESNVRFPCRIAPLKTITEVAVPYVATLVATVGTAAAVGAATRRMSQLATKHSWRCSCGHLVDPCTHGI